MEIINQKEKQNQIPFGRKRKLVFKSSLPATAARCNCKWICMFSELTVLL